MLGVLVRLLFVLVGEGVDFGPERVEIEEEALITAAIIGKIDLGARGRYDPSLNENDPTLAGSLEKTR